MSKDNFKGQNAESEVDNKIVTVGSGQSHRALVFAVIVILLCVVYYFYVRSPNKEGQELANKREVKTKIQDLKEKLEKVPDEVPAPERIVVNTLPPLPDIVVPKNIPEVKTEAKKPEEPKEEVTKPKEKPTKVDAEPKKLKSLPSLSTKKKVDNDSVASPSPLGINRYPTERRGASMTVFKGDKQAVDTGSVQHTTIEQSKSTSVGKFDLIIGQGKVIDAVLETAIHSNMTGMTRAVVSRDVYAEKGDIVLVPRGSRLVGQASFDHKIKKSYINVVWQRIILPHGIDVIISSPSTDELGIPGATGKIDNKIINKLFSSIMVAGLSIGSAIVSQQASALTKGMTALQMIKSITVNEIDCSSINDVIGLPSETELKLKSAAVNKIRNAASENELIKIFRAELKRVVKAAKSTLDPNWEQQISLDTIKDILRGQGGRSVYENIVQNSIQDTVNDMREAVKNNIDTEPVVYVNQGIALKVFVSKDIVFNPQAVLFR